MRCTLRGFWGGARSFPYSLAGPSCGGATSLGELDLKPRLPEIISSSRDARAIVLDLAPGEALAEHEVHERAWLIVVSGEVELATAAGQRVKGGTGLLVEVNPGERHEVLALSDARILLLLTPWPGGGHPGAMTITQKLYARRHAAKRAVEDQTEVNR
jgi:quercetin dioxygenase-like cupin family protein